MNYALVQRAEDLINWPGSTGRDSWGAYHIVTGYEGTGACFWCGTDLDGQHRRYCGHRKGCWTAYANHFYWSYASHWCCRRQDWTCVNCGWTSPYPSRSDSYTHGIEVHHIIALKGKQRACTPFNVPWNLIGLCHGCHLEIHAAMRPPKATRPGREIERGQLVLAL